LLAKLQKSLQSDKQSTTFTDKNLLQIADLKLSVTHVHIFRYHLQRIKPHNLQFVVL